MIDSVAAVLGLVSAGIFLAHAIESYRADALVEVTAGRASSSGRYAAARLRRSYSRSWVKFTRYCIRDKTRADGLIVTM